MQQTKDSDRSELHLLWEIPLSCEISIIREFFFQKFVKLSEPSLRLCRLFSTLVKGFKWPRAEVTGDIPFELGHFGIALETSIFFAPTLVLYAVFGVSRLYFQCSFLRLGIA